MLIDSDTTAVLIRDLKHAIIGAKGSRACRESCNGKDKNKRPAEGDAGWTGSSLAGRRPEQGWPRSKLRARST